MRGLGGRTAVRRAGSYALLRLSSQALELLGWLLIARSIPLTSFGELSIAFLVCRYLGLVGDWGASLRGPRDVVGRSDADVHGLVRTRQRVSTSLALAYVAGCVAIGREELAVLAIAVLSRGITRDWVALGRGSTTKAAAPALLQGLAIVGGAVLAASLESAAVVVGIGYALGAISSVLMNRVPKSASHGRGRPDGWMLLLTIGSQVLTSFDTLLLGWLRSAKEAGVYAGVYRLSTAITTAIGLVAVALIGEATRVADDPQARARSVRVARRSSGTILLAVALFAPIAYWLVPVLFGNAFSSGRTAGALVVLAAGFTAATHPFLVLHLAQNRDRGIAVQTAAVAVLNALVNLVVIPAHGLNGAAVSSLVAQAYLLGYFAWSGSGRRVA